MSVVGTTILVLTLLLALFHCRKINYFELEPIEKVILNLLCAIIVGLALIVLHLMERC